MRSISVDLSQFKKAMFYLPIEIKTEVRKTLKEQIGYVRDQARRNHRYTIRTGKLEKSTMSHVLDDKDGLFGEAYLESAGTMVKGGDSYGKYVHEGQRTWKPDKFLDKALEDRKPFIEVAIQQAVKRVCDRLFL